MDGVNTLDFVMFDPIEAREEWAVDFGSTHKVVEILIDGRSMKEHIQEIERPFIKEDPSIEDDTEQYGHVSPKSLYDDLMEAADPLYDSGLGVYLFCCASCGEQGCWSVTCKVKEDEQYVYWYDFQHEHRDWNYHLSFRFDKDAYEQAMRKLKLMSQKQMLYERFRGTEKRWNYLNP